MSAPRLLQPVCLRKALREAGLPAAATGRIIDLNPSDPLHVEVEFHVEDGSRFGRYVERIVPVSSLDLEEVTPASPEQSKFAQFDAVELIAPRPDLGLAAGAHGVVMDVYVVPSLGYHVEFLDSTGHTLEVATMYPNELTPASFRSGEQKSFPSPFRLLLLTDVWDGEKDGIAVDSFGSTYIFKMIGWDNQHEVRVFSLADTPRTDWGDIEAAFRFAGLGDGDRWVLPPSIPAEAESALRGLETSARLLGVIASRDLLGKIAAWRPLRALPDPEPAQGWIAWLGLPPSTRGTT